MYTSNNFSNLFGYDLAEVAEKGNSYFDSKIHADDFLPMMSNGISMFKFYYALPAEERSDYKLVNEYRILNAESKYIRVVEQHQALELDKQGNVWLSLSIMDISPDQGNAGSTGIKSQIINFKTGEIVSLDKNRDKKTGQSLTVRELSILNLINEGFFSKEISGKLSISIHTVNTHRQRILEKLNAANTVEAINYAKNLGLLS